jgi:hypothetical protein
MFQVVDRFCTHPVTAFTLVQWDCTLAASRSVQSDFVTDVQSWWMSIPHTGPETTLPGELSFVIVLLIMHFHRRCSANI